MRRTLSTDKAKELAKAQGLEGLEKAIVVAEGKGWNTVTLVAVQTEDGYDVSIEPPTGVMVAWMLPEWIAQEVAIKGGEPASDLHVTLAYLGDAASFTMEQQNDLIKAVATVVAKHNRFDGSIGGTGRFHNGEEKDPYWVGINMPELAAIRADIVTALTEAGIPLVGHGADGDWNPHITVAYIPADADTPPLTYNPHHAYVDAITVCVGPTRFRMDLQDPPPEPWVPPGWAPEIITKAVDEVEEERYTLAPFYIPEFLDAHGEWTDKTELQKTFWAFMGKEDKTINAQHSKEIIKAGERIDGMVMPTTWTVTMTKADGTTYEHTYPAGTPFLGVKWEPWAWELIKSGHFNGYSMGGTARKIMAEIPDPNEG